MRTGATSPFIVLYLHLLLVSTVTTFEENHEAYYDVLKASKLAFKRKKISL